MSENTDHITFAKSDDGLIAHATGVDGPSPEELAANAELRAMEPEQMADALRRHAVDPVCPNCGPDKQIVVYRHDVWPVACRCMRCLHYWEIERPEGEKA